MKKTITAAVLLASLFMFTGCDTDENISVDTSNTVSETSVSDASNDTAAVTKEAESVTEAVTSVTEITKETAETSAVTSEAVTEAISDTVSSETEKTPTGVSIESMNGLWENEGEYPDKLIFDNGKFYFIAGYSGIMTDGTVKIESTEAYDGKKSYFYVLRDDSGSEFESFAVTGEIPFNELISSGETEKYTNNERNFTRNENVFRDPSDADDFEGKWQGPRPYIDVEKTDEGYEVTAQWSSSAWETTEWKYVCEFDEASKKLVCSGDAVCTKYTSNDDGSSDETEVFSDGSGDFSLIYGVLFWNDEKDNSGKGYAFVSAE